MTVYKYSLPVADFPTVEIPRGAEVLSVAEQFGDLVVWARVDPQSPPVVRRFRVAGTGHQDVPAEWRFVGTVLMHGGVLVFHVFDAGEVP